MFSPFILFSYCLFNTRILCCNVTSVNCGFVERNRFWTGGWVRNFLLQPGGLCKNKFFDVCFLCIVERRAVLVVKRDFVYLSAC